MLNCDNSRLLENRLLNRSPPRAEVPCKISVRPKRFGGDRKASKMHSSCAEKAILSLLGKQIHLAQYRLLDILLNKKNIRKCMPSNFRNLLLKSYGNSAKDAFRDEHWMLI
jgi:hypothetical protein